ncbi:MAG: nickel pincer cofactor biosynthesis protein LarB [Oscillospiraceae bacterium]|jgi:NCAIR mutase (PurE)-related protein|nr:nickel pincer cofactor biosynthesis protein LarB [Oscillospiraceae bacterium]
MDIAIDFDRATRCGVPEVIYGEGKSKEQIACIVSEMLHHQCKNIIVTRLSENKAKFLEQSLFSQKEADNTTDTLKYFDTARIGVVSYQPVPRYGNVAVLCAGTSDVRVADEAAVIAELLGSNVSRFYDIGIAGLHRLLSNIDEIRKANVIIAVAGFEGALPSVVGGLVSAPVIALPSPVGYGTGKNGYAALLAMLNSCAPGISVVNIGNGFGAGYQAHKINSLTFEK